MELYGVVCNDERYGEQFVSDATGGGHLFFYWKEREAQYKADDLNKEYQQDLFYVKKVVTVDDGELKHEGEIA